MQPNTEPSPTDVAAVSAMLNGQPAPVEAPAPTPVAPTPVTPVAEPAPIATQPSPTTQPTDPFASLFASEPAAPVTEPVPAPVETPAPVEPVAPVVAPVEQPIETYQTYDEYMAEVLGTPEVIAQPDPETIDPNDPAAIKGFFDDLVNTAVKRAQAETSRATAIQTAEKHQWDTAFEKYGSLRTNRDLRDMVHSIRMANFQKGIAMTPTQAADKLLASLGQQYKQGAADAAVITTYEQVQPNGGGTGAPVETSLDKDTTLTAIQDGGETKLAAILDAEIKAGRTW